MATIKLSPSGVILNAPPDGTENWFKTHWANPNFETEKSVAFDNVHLTELLNQQCTSLILTKQVEQNSGKNTLAIAGININGDLQDNNSLMLLGNYFNTPTSDDELELDLNLFSTLTTDQTQDHTQSWGTPYKSKNKFDTLLKNYQKLPYQFNQFSTVTFGANAIAGLIAMPQSSKVAFLPGYLWLNTEKQNPEDNGGLIEKSSMPVETLVAVAIDSQDNVVGGPISPIVFWPPLYRIFG